MSYEVQHFERGVVAAAIEIVCFVWAFSYLWRAKLKAQKEQG